MDVLEVSGRWEWEVGDDLLIPFTYCDENDICKKLNLGSDMTKAQQTFNIPIRFLERKLVVCPLPKMLEDGSYRART
ncbi:unnamed protein product [Prunus armeniaca]